MDALSPALYSAFSEIAVYASRDAGYVCYLTRCPHVRTKNTGQCCEQKMLNDLLLGSKAYLAPPLLKPFSPPTKILAGSALVRLNHLPDLRQNLKIGQTRRNVSTIKSALNRYQR